MIIKDRTIDTIALLNFILILVGFSLFTTLFLPMSVSEISASTRSITIPTRGAILFISLLTILTNRSKLLILKTDVFWLFVFWGFYLLKLFWFIYISGTTARVYGSAAEYFIFTIGVVFIPMISVAVSYQRIDITKLFWPLFSILVLILFVTMIKNNQLLEGMNKSFYRQQGNVAMGNITYGHTAIMLSLISFWSLLSYKRSIWKTIILVFGFLFGIYIAFRAGSRSPILAFLLVIFIILFFRQKNILKSFYILCIVVVILILSFPLILKLIGSVSPTMLVRLLAALEGDTSGRDILLLDAWKQFLEAPIWGVDFVVSSGFFKGMYPHNVFLETLISVGIFGAPFIVYFIIKATIKAISLIRRKDSFGLISVVFLQYLIFQMFSNSFFYNGSIFFCLLAVMLNFRSKK